MLIIKQDLVQVYTNYLRIKYKERGNKKKATKTRIKATSFIC